MDARLGPVIRPDLEREDGTAAERRVWLLNFDAEDELRRGKGHNPTAGARARMETLVPLVRSLVGEDLVLADVAPRGEVRAVGHAWCPTPAALRRLEAWGAEVPAAPALDVLRRANHRRFCAELGATLPASGFFTDEAALAEHLSAGSPTGRWVLKRPLSFAGRGRLRCGDGARELGEVGPWIRASLAEGGVDVSPWYDRLADHALHGFVPRDPTRPLRLSAPTTQVCDTQGHWLRSSREHDLTAEEQRALVTEGERTGAALAAMGYFGPFGIDAFRFSTPSQPRFCPRIEVNARYTMAWALGW